MLYERGAGQRRPLPARAHAPRPARRTARPLRGRTARRRPDGPHGRASRADCARRRRRRARWAVHGAQDPDADRPGEVRDVGQHGAEGSALRARRRRLDRRARPARRDRRREAPHRPGRARLDAAVRAARDEGAHELQLSNSVASFTNSVTGGPTDDRRSQSRAGVGAGIVARTGDQRRRPQRRHHHRDRRRRYARGPRGADPARSSTTRTRPRASPSHRQGSRSSARRRSSRQPQPRPDVVVAVAAILVALLVAFRNPGEGGGAAAAGRPGARRVGHAALFTGIEYSPLTSISGPLIIAMGTEFNVLLMGRYYEERAAGLAPRDAMSKASLRIGRAITASGLTVMGGFAVLAFSDFPLLDNFGKVTASNIGLSLLSTLILLPPLLVWADEGHRVGGADSTVLQSGTSSRGSAASSIEERARHGAPLGAAAIQRK